MQNSITANRTLVSLQRWWTNPSNRYPVLIFVAARFLTLVVGVTAVQIGPVYNPYAAAPIYLASLEGRHLQGPLNTLIEPWHRWDSGWYMVVALRGYAPDDGTTIFAPLYPVLVAVAGALVGDLLLGGLLVSSLACLAFLLILYRLARRETRRDSAAQYTLLALITFPTAFYLLGVYTESVFLACTAGALLAALNRRWWLAALLAAAASFTRLQGWVLFFPIGWLAFVEAPRFWQAQGLSWRELLRNSIPHLTAVGAAPLAVLAFFVFLAVANLGSIGDAYEQYWEMYVRPPWSPVIDLIGRITAGTAQVPEYANLIALIFIIVGAVLSLRVLPLVYHLYIWPTLVLILLRYYPLYLLNGTLRYVLDFFPIFITFGIALVKHRLIGTALLAVGMILQVLFLFEFARWGWIS
jgi:Mannosyltransferase (PIG-V)